MRNRNCNHAKSLLLLLSIGISHSAWAQAETAEGANSTDIVVTAQRRAERLQDVPVSVGVVSGDRLARTNTRNLEELSSQQPALKIATGAASDQLNLRGVGSGFNAGFEQSVATFVDGVYRSRARTSRLALFDIDRVEILKGPQTIFFGANAIAGALNITTRKPSDELTVNASALYAPTDGEYALEGGISGPLMDTLKARVAVKASGMNGYVHNDRLDNKGPHLRDLQGRVQFQWDPSSNLSMTLRYDGARLRDTGTSNTEIIACPPVGSAPTGLCARALGQFGTIDDRFDYHSNAAANRARIDFHEIGLTTRLQLGDYSLNLISGYQHQRADVIPYNVSFPGLSPVGTQSFQWALLGERSKVFSQEVRLESPGDRPVAFQVGGYFDHMDLDLATKFGFFGSAAGALAAPYLNAQSLVGSDAYAQQKSSTLSGFGAVVAKPLDGLRLSGGLRYSRIEKKAHRQAVIGTRGAEPDHEPLTPAPLAAQLLLAGPTGTALGDYPITRRVDTMFMPSASVQYDLVRDVMVYASYAKGFKAGGFGANTADIFGPEKVDAFELGLKSQWFGRRLTTNIALFDSKYRDLQETSTVTTSAGGLISVVNNAASMRSRGIELETRAIVARGLTLWSNVSYLDAHYQKFTNAPCTPNQRAVTPACIQDLSGQRRAFAPSWSGSVGADVEQPVTDDLLLRLGASLYFTTGYFLQANHDPLSYQPGYQKLDLRAAIGPRDGRWEVAVIAKNVNDARTASFRVTTPGTVGTGTLLPDRPRSVAFQVSTKW
ncbi:TonB-dependent receptor [Rhizorhabdus wittichii]